MDSLLFNLFSLNEFPGDFFRLCRLLTVKMWAYQILKRNTCETKNIMKLFLSIKTKQNKTFLILLTVLIQEDTTY